MREKADGGKLGLGKKEPEAEEVISPWMDRVRPGREGEAGLRKEKHCFSI